MLPRFPLFGKIAAWLMLNVALLGAVGWFTMQHQLHFGFDSVLGRGAGDRVRALARVVVQALNENPREEWNEILARLEGAYPVRMFLFARGEQLAGTAITLPREVQARLAPLENELPNPPPPPLRMDANAPPPEENRPGFPPRYRPPGPVAPRNPVIVGFLRTSQPSQYWILIRAPLGPPRPGPATLVLASDTLSAGGLIFDYAPLLWAAAAALALSVLFWFPLIHGITRSIASMRSVTAQIAEGHFDIRVDARRRDELGSLGAAINSMSERLAGLVGGQHRFLSDVAHELCAPLSRLQMALGILEQRAAEADRTRLLDVREEVDHMADLVNELLSFSRASFGLKPVQLTAVPVREIVEKAARREAADPAQIEITGELNCLVRADPALLQRAVSNLLRNALLYASHAGLIEVTIEREKSDVLLTIADRGPGVAEESLPQLFDPFFRVDLSRTRATGGVGLGLTITKACVESCGGAISVENARPHGLRVTIRLAQAYEDSRFPSSMS